MFSNEQAEMMKLFLYNWSRYGATAIVATEENLNELCNQINEMIIKNEIFNGTYQHLNWRLMMIAIMKNCPNIFAHYNPNEKTLNLNFDTMEMNMLYGNLTTVVATKRDEICAVSREILNNNDEIFIKNVNKKSKK